MASSRLALTQRRWFPWVAWVLAGLVALSVAFVVESRSGGHRLTAARMTTIDTTGYQLPPAVSPESLRTSGQAVTMPHAPPPLFAPTTETSPQKIATRVTWYSLSVPPLPNDGRQLYLYIPRWKSDGSLAIYADGQLIHQSHANLQWNGSNEPLLIKVPRTDVSQPPRTLDVRMQHVRGIGGAFSSVWIGTYRQLAPRYTIREILQVQLTSFSSFAFLATGVFAFFVWLSRRNEPIYLLYFLTSAVVFVRMLHTFVGMHPLIISDAWFGWLTVVSPYWMVMVLHLFMAELHGKRQPLLTGAALLVSVVTTIATLPGLIDPTLMSAPVYASLLVLGVFVAFNSVRQSVRFKSRDAMLLSVWCLITVVSGIYDLGLQQNLISIESVFVSNFTGVGFTLLFWYIMFGRYIEALETATQAKADLARRLAQREAELTASHAKLREIERRELLHQERQRLMQDMHDGLGSTLVGALRAFEGGKAAELDTVGILRGCIDDLKLTIDSMEPVETDLLLLLATLRFRLQPRLEAAGVKLVWDAGEVPPLEWLDQRHALHILRILQEAIANVLKHSGAKTLTVSVRAEGDQVLVRVQDDGRGFEPAGLLPSGALSSGGRGLANQLSRAEAIGGAIRWEETQRGSSLALALPVSKSRRAVP